MDTQQNEPCAAGDLDLSFGDQGKVVLEFSETTFVMAYQVMGMPDGKLLIVGDSRTGYAVGKTTKDGVIDTDFGNYGAITGVFETGHKAGGRTISLQPDGKIVMSGLHFVAAGDGTFDVYRAVARFEANGDVDIGFGTDGKFIFPLPQSKAQRLPIHPNGTGLGNGGVDPDAVTVLPNGKILFTSSFTERDDKNGFLIQLNADGSLDMEFNGQGYTKVRHPKFPTWTGPMLITSDGNVIVAGNVKTGATGIKGLFARYLPDGMLDTSFGVGGFAIVDESGSPEHEINAITQGVDDKLIGIGVTREATQNGMLVSRKADGGPDLEFNGGKVTVLPLDDRGHTWRAGKLLFTTRLLVVGSTFGGESADVVLARYRLNGALDLEFGSEKKGWVRTKIGKSVDIANSLLLQQDAKIIVAGSFFDDSGLKGVLLRYWN